MRRVCAATPAEDCELRMVSAQLAVLTRQLSRITGVEGLGLVEFRVALA
jgi:hypothetical protein